MSLLAMDRRKIILERIQNENSVKVTELAIEFDVTEETIRRDLEKLELEGYVTRTYGGAVLVQSNSAELSINVREMQNPEGKRRIARRASELIKEGATIMIDSSSTSIFVAKNLKNQKEMTIITNSTRIPQDYTGGEDTKIILTGGIYRPEIMSLVGVAAENTISRYYADYAIIGCKAMDAQEGVTFEPHESESLVKQKMVQNAQKVILVADHTKFGRKSSIRTLKAENIHILITDEKLDPETENSLMNKGVEIIYA